MTCNSEDQGCSRKICNAQCSILQNGRCQHLCVDQINELLDKTDWEDLDKGEIITPYILKEDRNDTDNFSKI